MRHENFFSDENTCHVQFLLLTYATRSKNHEFSKFKCIVTKCVFLGNEIQKQDVQHCKIEKKNKNLHMLSCHRFVSMEIKPKDKLFSFW